MKIAILGPILWDSIWGHGQELTRILSDNNDIIYFEPVVHSSKLNISFKRTAKNPVPQNVKIIKRDTKLGLNPLYGIYVEFKNLLCLTQQDYDVFITYYTTCGLLATIFSRLTGKKVILMYVDDLAEWYDPKIAKYLTKYFFTPLVAKLSNFVVTTAHKLNESIQKYNKNVKRIPNGVDLAFFETKKAVLNKHESNNTFIVGFIGSFGNRINYDLLIKTASKLKSDEEVKFLLIGEGEGIESFKCQINRLKLDNIQLMEPVNHSDVPEMLNKMDVCIIPFKINRLTDCICPVKLFEYWAMEKAVISTNFYEISKIAKDRVIFADNPKEMKHGILELKNNKNLKEKYEKIGFKEVVKKYNWNVLATEFHKIIK